MTDLDDQDAKMVAEAVQESESLDQAITSVVGGFPSFFHASMIEDLRSMDQEDTEKQMERQIEEADAKLWQAKMMSFESLLQKDLASVKRASHGHAHLKDRLLET